MLQRQGWHLTQNLSSYWFNSASVKQKVRKNIVMECNAMPGERMCAEYTLQEEPAATQPKFSRISTRALGICYHAIQLIITSLVLCILITFVLYMKESLVPIVQDAHKLVDKTNAVFYLLYEYLCVKTQLITVEDCSSLRITLT